MQNLSHYVLSLLTKSYPTQAPLFNSGPDI